jgi:hypothetical protein
MGAHLAEAANHLSNVFHVPAVFPHSEGGMLADPLGRASNMPGGMDYGLLPAPIVDRHRLIPVERTQDVAHATPEVYD